MTFLPPRNAQPIHRYNGIALLRETAIRAHLVMPETELENKWFNEGTDINQCGDFKDRLLHAVEVKARIKFTNPICSTCGHEPCICRTPLI